MPASLRQKRTSFDIWDYLAIFTGTPVNLHQRTDLYVNWIDVYHNKRKILGSSKSVTSYKNKYLRQYNQYIGNASSITATRQIYLRKNDQYVHSNSTNMNTENTTNIYTCMRLAAIVQIYIIYGKYTTNICTTTRQINIPQIYVRQYHKYTRKIPQIYTRYHDK